MTLTSTETLITQSSKVIDSLPKLPQSIGTDYTFKRKIVWKNVLGFIVLHTAALYGLYLALFKAKHVMIFYAFFMAFISGEGITVGAHRLYSHKAFKAKFVTRLVLMILQTMAGQNCMYIWVRDHRLHHKFSDTDADPHNANRGFFFCHMGWLMSKKHPLVIAKGKTIDMSDLEADSLVMFQKRFYKTLYTIFAIAIPVAIPVYFWNETWWNSLFISYFFRYVLLLHITWFVNSIAHLWGTRPFDKEIKPVESKFVGFVAIGEGWHNYHHAFPWDYRAAELGAKYNVTTFVIDALAYFDLVYDLKQTPYTIIERRALKKGDGSHVVFGKKCEYKDYKHLEDDAEVVEKYVRVQKKG